MHRTSKDAKKFLASRIRVMLLMAVCVRSLAADANSEFVIRAWGVNEGLPQSFVTALVQTRDRYLWVGTYGGLTRFNGTSFTTFSSGSTPGLLSDRILGLCEDSEAALWIATEDAGVTRYTHGAFTTFTTHDGLPSNLVRGVLAMRNGALWVATLNGLARLHGKRFEPVELPAPLKGSDVLSLGQGQDGRLLIGTNRGVAEWKDERFVAFHSTSYLVIYVFEDHSRNVWLGSPDGFYLLAAEGAFRVAPEARGEVRAILENSSGDLCVGAGNGLFRRSAQGSAAPRQTAKQLASLSDGALGTKPVVREFRRPNAAWSKLDRTDGLSGNFVRALLEDSEGDLWAGTNANGLNCLRKGAITTIAAGPGAPAGSVVPLLEDRTGAMWMGLPARGLLRFLPSKRAATEHAQGTFRLFGPQDGLAESVVWSLLESRQGGLWIGERGLSSYRNGHFQVVQGVGRSLSEGLIFSIYEGPMLDKQGERLWIGRSSGLFRIERGAVTAAYNKSNGLAGDEVRCITADRSGALWIGTAGGLSRFEHGAFRNYTTANGLPHNYVSAIYVDDDDTLWVGTYGGGLARMRNGRFRSFNVSNGLSENVVLCILADSHKNLWLSGNRGIHRVNRRELNDFADAKRKSYQVLSYGTNDGMKTVECNGGGSPAGWKTHDGRLCFPTQRGVAIIDPDNMSISRQAPAVLIEQLSVDGKASDSTRELTIRPGMSRLEIHYTGISFAAPERVRFRYRLSDVEPDWVDAGTRRTAYYTRLPAGRFHFQVIAANANGVWESTGAGAEITVISAFWQTWWFYSLTALLFLAGVRYVYQQRVEAIEKANAQRAAYASELIASQEGERQRIAAELHDSLGQTLAIIRNRALMSLQEPKNQTRAVEQMDEIADAASAALDEVRAIAHNLRPYQIDRLGLHKSIEIMLGKAAGSSHTRFRAEIEDIDRLLPPELRIHVYRIVQEAVNNILHHSAATEASVAVRSVAGGIDIHVSDNGKGFAQLTDGHPRGMGLNGIAERTRILSGRLTVIAAPGHGASIHVSIPAAVQAHG